MYRRFNEPRRWALILHMPILFTLSGCNTGDMRDQPKYEPLEPNVLFADSRASRPLVEGTVARGIDDV